MTTFATEAPALGLHSLEDYAPLIGAGNVDRIMGKAARLDDRAIVHVNSTLYGGGVAELLTPLTLLMNESGLRTGWRTIQGTPEFFQVTKLMHNGLQGSEIELSPEHTKLFEEVALENAARMHLEDHDVIIVHDPQPLPLVQFFNREALCVWQCHVDLSAPDPALWRYLAKFIERYNLVVLSLQEYRQRLNVEQRFIMPAINPFSSKNRELSEAEIDERFAHYGISTELPLIVQASRFDAWKDPQGVIDAFRMARREVPCALVLAGNGAADDPDGQALYEAVLRQADENITVILADDPVLVNALQRRAAVVLQKSLREGFGLTVSEAMWKGACVIGGNVGGIRRQITDGENGFLVENCEQAADRIVQALKSPDLRRSLGKRARETVRENFLMSRLMEDWIDVIAQSPAVRGRQRAQTAASGL